MGTSADPPSDNNSVLLVGKAEGNEKSFMNKLMKLSFLNELIIIERGERIAIELLWSLFMYESMTAIHTAC